MNGFFKSRTPWLAACFVLLVFAMLLSLTQCVSHTKFPATTIQSAAPKNVVPGDVTSKNTQETATVAKKTHQHDRYDPPDLIPKAARTQSTTNKVPAKGASIADTSLSGVRSHPNMPPSSPVAHTPMELLLEVHINQQAWHETDLFLGFGATPDDNLYASGSDLQRWRLKVPGTKPYRYEGKDYYPLDAISGLSYHVDASTETLWITAPPASFSGTVVDGLFPENPRPQHTPWGGFLNYDFLGSSNPDTSSIDSTLEAGLFNNWGVGTSSFLGQNINHAHSQWIRLDTTWTHDDPDNMTSLQIGDTINDPGMAGLAVRMGGIEYGTNFATRPYLVTFPLPAIAGQAALPSTVQLYVNGLLKQSQQVPPGPFSIPAIPTVTGPGTATVVVQDMLGHEQVITTSFYATAELLKAGLNDYSFSAGMLRDNYGLESNDYGPSAATGTFRHGFTDNFTGELRAENSGSLKDVSAGAVFATPAAGVFNAALALGHSELGRGALGILGYQWQGKVFNAGANIQLASPDFTELGYNGLPAPHKQVTASIGAFAGRGGSVSLAYLDQDSPMFGQARLLTANYSVNVGRNGFFTASAFHSLTSDSNNGVLLMFTLPFGERSSVSAGVQRQDNVGQAFAQVQENLPTGTGSGYRVSTQAGPDAMNQAEYDYQNSVGTYRVGVLSAAGQTSYAGEAAGGLAFIGDGVFPARQIQGAFGLVEVPSIPNVTVYADNQPVGITDKNGDALVPIMRPYQNNPISLDAGSLPLSSQVNSLQQNAVPRFNSGVIVKFPITSTRGATLTILLQDGEPLPAGASVQIEGQNQKFPVGFNGEVYVTGLATHTKLRANWDHQSCDMSVNLPVTNDPLPDLGTYVCRGVTP